MEKVSRSTDTLHLSLYLLSSLDPPSHLSNRNRSAALLRYVDNVRRHGHRAANIDPLELMDREEKVAALESKRYGLNPTDSHDIQGIMDVPESTLKGLENGKMKIEDITEHLRKVYLEHLGIEFMHCGSKAVRNWVSFSRQSRVIKIMLRTFAN